ncbi:hypothetical protein MMC18_007827 [Xylographa bjoerkii]|nr:hypothetical protein [Xylographa bjoerkii]
MRPMVGGDALPALSRKQSFADPEVTTPIALLSHGGPTTFFMASESMLEASETASTPAAGSDSNFGIRSLDSTIDAEEAEQGDEEQDGTHDTPSSRRRSTIKGSLQKRRDQPTVNIGHTSASSSPDTSPSPRHSRWQLSDAHPQLATQASVVSLALGSSIPSSPKSTSTHSLRLSDEDSCGDGASQAIVSSGDEDNDHENDAQGTPPQLIMPSIMMPSRRPFTERGKTIGRLKVLIAGASGVGKSSLIKSIVQVCEDIVHVDPLSSNPPSLESLSSRKTKTSSKTVHFSATNQILEVYASTKAYPSWWSDFEDSIVLRRRKTGGDTVLERNVCFVDTPGYDSGISVLESMDSVLQYIEAQMAKNTSFSSMSDLDLLSMLGGGGGFQVDVVLYLFTKDLQPTDIEFLSRLSQTTNVIPLLAKADTLSEDDITQLKATIPGKLEATGIRPFVFTAEHATALPPYTVCSSASNDEDNMDASLLMSPDYIQPLLPSELSILVKQIFDKDNASWLRHSAAKKIIQWRKTPRAMSIITPTSRISFPPHYNRANTSPLTISTTSVTSASQAIVSYPNSPLSYTHARIADHTQREERLAQVQLASWAGNLQRSLQNERGRYEALAHGQRATWLRERLSECNTNGSLLTSSQETTLVAGFGNDGSSSKETSARTSAHRGLMHPADPLGLLRWNEVMKRRGWIAFQAGSLGALAVVAVWVVRNWGLSMGYDGSTSWSWNWFTGAE